MHQNKISAEMLKENCDWITFKINPPSASHAGGVGERHIRTIHSILTALLEKSASSLDGESFHMLICETKAIVNNRPLTVDSLSDPESPSPLTPNHILVIVKDDNKARNRWSLARVVEMYLNKADGLVRSVKVAVGDPDLSSTGKRVHPPSVLERPIQKLVLLLPREERQGFPHGEPFNEEIQKKD